MLHYYFYKYWSRVLVGTMVGVVVISFGLFTFSLTATHKTGIENAESANRETTQNQAYQKSADLFGKIQDLKLRKQDTSRLEALYTKSVQNLSNQKQEAAVTQLNQLETQIAKINESLALSPTPVPGGIIASVSGVLSPSVSPSEAVKVEGASFTSSGSANVDSSQ